MLIYTNKYGLERATDQHKTKLLLLETAINIASDFIEVKDKKLFAADPLGYFDAAFIAKVSSANPMRLTREKYFTTIGLSDAALLEAIREFNKCTGSLLPPVAKDYEYHTENAAQEKKVIAVQKFMEACADLNVKPEALAPRMNGILYFDIQSSQLVPNLTFIRG